jgi:hypothetical protein
MRDRGPAGGEALKRVSALVIGYRSTRVEINFIYCSGTSAASGGV